MSEGSGPQCPECGRPATGNFCRHCGAGLGGRFCNQCGSEIPADATFCSQCGAKVAGRADGAQSGVGPGAGASAGTGHGLGSSAGARRGAARPQRGSSAAAARGEAAASVFGGQNLAWWIAGAAMFALIVFAGVSMVRPGPGPAPGATTGGGTAPATPAGGGVPPDLTDMTPIEAADRLYNRVMEAVSVGDSTQAQAFLPMAIAAYQRARPLSLDGLFHLSMLNRTAGNYEAALVQALEIVEQDPGHLLGLAAAAQAAVELGELDEAEAHYRTILEVYDEEAERGLEEYQVHGPIVEGLRGDAESFLAGR